MTASLGTMSLISKVDSGGWLGIGAAEVGASARRRDRIGALSAPHQPRGTRRR